MTNCILRESATRAEYKRRWKALARARAKGLDVELLSTFYGAMIAKGFTAEATKEALFLAARNGAFGFVNAWER